MKPARSIITRALVRAAIGVATLALIPYALGPVYSFPAAQPFTGSALWNPYATLSGTWQRANLHAHGRAWGGVTSGQQSDQAVVARYHELGYSVAGVSNYQYIAARHGVKTLPLYEHGFNIGKNHQLAVGAREVDWFDFPLWQTASNQQYVIDRLRRTTELVSLNHPSSRSAYDVSALKALTGYQLIEIVNGPFTVEDVWDAALGAGRPVWAVGNDDTHDLNDQRRLAAGWTMIDAPSPADSEILGALRAGRSYAVQRTGAIDGANSTRLDAVAVQGETVRVSLTGEPSTIAFVGVDGAVRHVEKNVTTADYTLTPHDPYVRAVITAPQATLYLNPVIRWNGRSLPAPLATVNAAATWLQRGAILMACVLIGFKLRARRASAALATSTPATRRAS